MAEKASVDGGERGNHIPLGQHFLVRPEIAGWVAGAISLTRHDTVLEIGPGHGILTRELLARTGSVVAIEKDYSLVAELRETFVAEICSGQLTLIEQDIRDFDPVQCSLLGTRYSLVANIPYYITGYIIRKFLTTKHQPADIAVLVQKEVAERIVAGDGKESLLSLSVKAYGTPGLVRIVKAGAFSPPPKVDSAILRISGISSAHFTSPAQEARFFELLHIAFSQKRKQVGGTLGKMMSNHPLSKKRPEDLTLEQWIDLTNL